MEEKNLNDQMQKQEDAPKKQRTYKMKHLIIVGAVAAVLAFAVAFPLGTSFKANQEAVAVFSQQKEQQDAEFQKQKSHLDGIKNEISRQQNILDQMEQYEKDKETLDAEIADKKGQVDALNTNIAEKQHELDTLTGNITAAKAAPKTLPSGQYTVGTDLPEGRYRVSGSSNFVVKNSSGRLKVNTILGDGLVGEGDYVCTLDVGDSIDTGSKTTFTPIS